MNFSDKDLSTNIFQEKELMIFGVIDSDNLIFGLFNDLCFGIYNC